MVDVERPGAQQWVPGSDEGTAGPAGGHPDVDALRAAAPACRGCELWEPATQVVFSAGNPHGRVVLVGEQPGDVEDTQGIPFVGPAGRLLQKALDEAGLQRQDLYVTNAVKHFRFEQKGKRRIHQTPELAHMVACRPWLQAELEAVDPRVLVLLGATAAKTLLGGQFRVTKERGVLGPRDTTAGRFDVLPTVHPSSILRGPPEQRDEAFAALVADLAVVTEHLARA
ncbi:UdgX family uracil-DNA binding protein [Aquipuribacter hungaricus]|uniref:Type-4 uracil-DNA glycosylase n=1 Tax=Aquipuribacter hungaricus TaxID=545624 RepID=A0ABV7WNE5_9MICO